MTIRPNITMPLIALLGAIAGAHWGYFAFQPDIQARVFRIGNAILGMTLCGLLLYYGPQIGFWALACLWGYSEDWQSAVCRIATFDDPAPGGSMLCTGVVGIKPYAAILAASLALLAFGLVKPWPRP